MPSTSQEEPSPKPNRCKKSYGHLFDLLNVNNEKELSDVALRQAFSKTGTDKKLVTKFMKEFKMKKGGSISKANFTDFLASTPNDLLVRTLMNEVAIPDWCSFTKELEKIAEEVEKNTSGLQAQYIPQLAEVDPDQFAVAVCTVDGQMWTYGDCKVPFSIQSCSKPITYCVAETLKGAEKVKKHVGHEPSGVEFNAFLLDSKNLPHNPMVNAGAIMTASLVHPEKEPAERFQHMADTWAKLASDTPVGFDNATFLSESRTADRNFALAYFMKDMGAFDSDVKTIEDLRKHLSFYFQNCSLLADTKQVAYAAGTLANGGTNPITKKDVFSPETTRNVLSLMFSCGMYDYSGEFSYKVGLPAKSGVAGCVFMVIPNLCGICVWSPRLDEHGNSVRGVEFCESLTKIYATHVFSDPHSELRNLRVMEPDVDGHHQTGQMCYAAANGDLFSLRCLLNRGASVNGQDYDGRSALHLACAEGNIECVKFLLEQKADVNIKDRWGTTPREEAAKYERADICELLKAC